MLSVFSSCTRVCLVVQAPQTYSDVDPRKPFNYYGVPGWSSGYGKQFNQPAQNAGYGPYASFTVQVRPRGKYTFKLATPDSVTDYKHLHFTAAAHRNDTWKPPCVDSEL